MEWDPERRVWFVKETQTHLIEVMELIYTSAIVVTPKSALELYDDRWCYTSTVDASIAADLWDGDWPNTEPTGWHRHHKTGRRRVDGDPAREYIRF